MFPVTHSILSAEALMAELACAYSVGTPVSCEMLRVGMNDTYLLTTRDNRYVARVYRARLRSPSDVSYEAELLLHLATKGVSVAVPIPGRDGALCRDLMAPEGARQLVLFTYAAGKPLSWDVEEHCQLAGRVAALIHAASDGFTSRHPRLQLDLNRLIDVPLKAIERFYAQRREDLRYLETVAAKLRIAAETAAARGLDWGVCHGDLSGANIHLADDGTWTVIDFDLCGPGWRAYDLSAVQQVARYQNKTRTWDLFVRGYLDTRPIAASDLAAVPLFHAIGRLWSMGVCVENAADWGTLSVSGGRLDHKLAFLREWEATQV